MRAITGAVVFSKPCSLAKAIGILARFADSAASHLPSSDAATYLRTAAEAANDLHIFRRDLRRSQQQQGGDVEAAHEGVEREGGASEKKHRRARDQDRERKAEAEAEAEAEGEENGVMVLAAGPQGTSGEKKSKTKKKETEKDEENAVPHGGLHSPASEKRKKKKEKHGKEEDQTGNVDEKENMQTFDAGLQNLPLEEGIDKEKSGKKKKKHLKQEEEARGVKEEEQAMVHVGVASEKKKRKRMEHTKEEEEKKVVIDGDLGSDKKRKKKRSRGDDIDNGNYQEQVEHTKKKQQK